MMEKFFAELLRRWGAKQPWFFKVITWITLAVSAIAGIPAFLMETGIWEVLPESVTPIILQIVSVSGLVGSFISKLTVRSDEKEKRDIVD